MSDNTKADKVNAILEILENSNMHEIDAIISEVTKSVKYGAILQLAAETQQKESRK